MTERQRDIHNATRRRKALIARIERKDVKDMTNFEKWQLLMKDCVSPQEFIDFGYYYLIGAALQRRVWVGPDHMKLYPNTYIILVGEAGIGKGLVIKTVSEMLKHHKMDNFKISGKPKPSKVEEGAVDASQSEITLTELHNMLTATGDMSAQKNKVTETPNIIPVAADATTYEALCRAMAQSTRRINYRAFNPLTKKDETKIYTHASLCFCLEEISSVFKIKASDVAKFFLNAFDCGDYEYDTKTQGKDQIRRMCLSFFGGTTPSFMQETFDDKILSDGFSSRTIFVMGTENRRRLLFYPPLSPEQTQAKKHLLDHIKKLTGLYGATRYTPEAEDYLKEWWEVESLTKRPNLSAKLDNYYSRKNIHVQKLAMAIHYGESLDPLIHRFECEQAMAAINRVEKKMHFALEFEGANPLSRLSKKVVIFVAKTKERGASKGEITAEFWDDAPEGATSIAETLGYLVAVKKIKLTGNKYHLMLQKDENTEPNNIPA